MSFLSAAHKEVAFLYAEMQCHDLARPCCRACSAGRFEAVRALVEEGHATVDVRDGQGGTPLYVAAASGHQAIALYLLSKGANVEASSLPVPLSMPCRAGQSTDFPAVVPV